MPICNTAAMNHHLYEISSQVAAEAHAVVILDGIGWHRSQGLVVPLIEEVRFAADSLVEGAVTSELVSESEIPGGSQK